MLVFRFFALLVLGVRRLFRGEPLSSFPRRRESSKRFWIPAFAGMTKSADALLSAPSMFRRHHSASAFTNYCGGAVAVVAIGGNLACNTSAPPVTEVAPVAVAAPVADEPPLQQGEVRAAEVDEQREANRMAELRALAGDDRIMGALASDLDDNPVFVNEPAQGRLQGPPCDSGELGGCLPIGGLGDLGSASQTGGVAVARLGDPRVSGPLPREVVARIVRRHSRELRRCYEEGLARTPSLQGEVTLRWIIAASGQVSSSTIEAAQIHDQRVGSCLIDTVKEWTFPAAQGTTVTIYPVVFSSVR